jgi:hypothetical protein
LNFAAAYSDFAIFTNALKRRKGYKQKIVFWMRRVTKIAMTAKTFFGKVKKS